MTFFFLVPRIVFPSSEKTRHHSLWTCQRVKESVMNEATRNITQSARRASTKKRHLKKKPIEAFSHQNVVVVVEKKTPLLSPSTTKKFRKKTHPHLSRAKQAIEDLAEADPHSDPNDAATKALNEEKKEEQEQRRRGRKKKEKQAERSRKKQAVAVKVFFPLVVAEKKSENFNDGFLARAISIFLFLSSLSLERSLGGGNARCSLRSRHLWLFHRRCRTTLLEAP